MTSFGLKLFAMFSMILDHIGLMFLQDNEMLYSCFRMLGRLAFPIFAFQLAIGYSHSQNKEKHIVRMLVFAILSQFPFWLYIQTAIPGFGHALNIGFTFSLALLCMHIIDNVDNIIYKFFLLISIFILSSILPIDYGVIGVILCVSFYIFRNHKYLNLISATILTVLKVILEQDLLKFAMIYALIPIFLFNGKKGFDNKFSKNLFYIFYPIHLLLFAVIKMLI